MEDGSKALHTSIEEKETLAQKSFETPPPQSHTSKSVNRDLEGCWDHPTSGPECEKYHCLQTTRLMATSLLAY
eukprot:1137037-Pelagomonas_calceolata.AAC.6